MDLYVGIDIGKLGVQSAAVSRKKLYMGFSRFGRQIELLFCYGWWFDCKDVRWAKSMGTLLLHRVQYSDKSEVSLSATSKRPYRCYIVYYRMANVLVICNSVSLSFSQMMPAGDLSILLRLCNSAIIVFVWGVKEYKLSSRTSKVLWLLTDGFLMSSTAISSLYSLVHVHEGYLQKISGEDGCDSRLLATACHFCEV